MTDTETTSKNAPVDLCALEAVQLIGYIQPHGFLLAVSGPDLLIQHVSANVSKLLGVPAERTLGLSLESVLGKDQCADLLASLATEDSLPAGSLRMTVGANALLVDCMAHRQQGMLIVECELLEGASTLGSLQLDEHVRLPFLRMIAAADILDLSCRTTEDIRRLSGFERVLVYRFDEEWNGEVIAESSVPSPVSYLGHHFPASDIPPQVRRLFELNPLRCVADTEAERVPILAAPGKDSVKTLDLTQSLLRCAASIHLTYLRNMHVRSTMTISLMVGNRLWGMIACHHRGAHRVDRSTRSLCELIAKIFCSQLQFRIEDAALRSRLNSHRVLENYMARIEASGVELDAGHFVDAELMTLFAAEATVCRLNGFFYANNSGLDEAPILPVIEKLKARSSRGVASSHELRLLEADAVAYAALASGAIYISLDAPSATTDPDGTNDGGNYLLLLRRERVETIIWAGNPDKTLSTDPQGALSPRTSFESWQQRVEHRCAPWSEIELHSAHDLRDLLLGLLAAQRARKAEQRIRYLARFDSLTGLINRHYIHIELDRCVREAEEGGPHVSVLFLDLDGFKSFNDTLGHAAGDRILQIVAKRMLQQVRTEDIVGRLGGDEFIIILRGVHVKEEIFQVVARILRAIEVPLQIVEGTEISISASIGLSRYPIDGTTGEMLVSCSDTAMYRVKRSGGSAFKIFQADDAAEEIVYSAEINNGGPWLLRRAPSTTSGE
jgi:diguanylate cyclase (GGDEF)-like protein